jgi:hypothetical protein
VAERGNPGFIVWSPDGVQVTFESGNPHNLFRRRADGGGEPERLTTSPNSHAPSSWSPDGKILAFVETDSTVNHVWVLPDGGQNTAPRRWPNTHFNEAQPDWSPDGRWIAYNSDESGRDEVYVQQYPGPGARYAVSRDGGWGAAWSRDGRELFYEAPAPGGQVTMMTVPVTTAPAFSLGTPRKLFQGPFIVSDWSRSYDVTQDGRRFVIIQAHERAPLPVNQIVVVENWAEELKRLAPK